MDDDLAREPQSATTSPASLSGHRRKSWLEYTSIGVSCVAVLISWLALRETRAQQAQQAQNSSVQLYNAYLQLLMEHPADFGETKGDAGSVVISTAEAIYLAQRPDPGWLATAKRMLLNHKDLVQGMPWDCATLNDHFLDFARQDITVRCLPVEQPKP
jgi:hypothetical protein